MFFTCFNVPDMLLDLASEISVVVVVNPKPLPNSILANLDTQHYQEVLNNFMKIQFVSISMVLFKQCSSNPGKHFICMQLVVFMAYWGGNSRILQRL
jgi:hypothetical protein